MYMHSDDVEMCVVSNTCTHFYKNRVNHFT